MKTEKKNNKIQEKIWNEIKKEEEQTAIEYEKEFDKILRQIHGKDSENDFDFLEGEDASDDI